MFLAIPRDLVRWREGGSLLRGLSRSYSIKRRIRVATSDAFPLTSAPDLKQAIAVKGWHSAYPRNGNWQETSEIAYELPAFKSIWEHSERLARVRACYTSIDCDAL